MTPRLLKLKDAAAYCGIPVRNFKRNVGIKPVRLGPHELWDREKLDSYISALQGETSRREEWTDAVAKF